MEWDALTNASTAEDDQDQEIKTITTRGLLSSDNAFHNLLPTALNLEYSSDNL